MEKLKKFKEIISAAQENLYSLEFRKMLQDGGVNICPSNFYSSIPSISEIQSSYEYIESEGPPYLNPKIFDAGLLRDWLNLLIPYAKDFKPSKEGDEESCKDYFLNNSQFSYSDAFAYYSFVRHLKPKKVIEIGSGFSSLVAQVALHDNNKGDLICIEPYPRPFIESLADEGALKLLKFPAQEMDAKDINNMLSDGDILFIDSTHTVKSGSDCLHIYLRLIPAIEKRVFIHIHDVFLPFGLPKSWLLDHQIFWTEQYLLLAFLIDNPKTKVLFGSAYSLMFNKELLIELMNGQYPPGGGSFWFEYNPTC